MTEAPLGVLLAGGRSRRFGADKRHTSWKGVTLAERAAAVLSSLTDTVVVSVGAGDAGSAGDVEGLEGLTRVADPRPDEGPLGGLAACLRYGRERGLAGALVLAVDLPHVDASHLKRILSQREPGREIVAAASASDRREQPLCGWYSVSLIDPLELYLSEGGRTVGDFVAARATHWVLYEPRVLTNVNRPEDLRALGAES